MRLAELAPPGGPTSGSTWSPRLDGKATIDWRTKGLSTELDRRLFHSLRTQADAVMVGAGTVRLERYGRMTKSDELREKRVAEGLAPDPLAVVVSARLDLPADLPLLNEPEQRVVIATASDAACPVSATRSSTCAAAMTCSGWSPCSASTTGCARSFARADRPSTRTCSRRPRRRAVPDAQPEGRGRRRRLTIVAGRELVEPAELELVSVAEGEVTCSPAGGCRNLANLADLRPRRY